MVKTKLFVLMVGILVALPLLAKNATGGEWWDKFGEPQYGGKLTILTNRLGDSFEPKFPPISNYESYVQLFMWDLTMPRDKWSFKLGGCPPKYAGRLAETWEWTNPQTLVVQPWFYTRWWIDQEQKKSMGR